MECSDGLPSKPNKHKLQNSFNHESSGLKDKLDVSGALDALQQGSKGETTAPPKWDYQGDADIISFYYDQDPNKYEKSFLDDPVMKRVGFTLFFIFVLVLPAIIGCCCTCKKLTCCLIDNIAFLADHFDAMLGRDRRYRPFRQAFHELGYPPPTYKEFVVIRDQIKKAAEVKKDVYAA